MWTQTFPALERTDMRHARAITVLLALLSASAMAGNDAPNVGDEQMTCAGAAAQEYETANAALAQRATADEIMSVEDTIAQRRLAEDYCKRWAACLVRNITEAGLRRMLCGPRLLGASAAKRKILSEERIFHR
jgi:hypothetical protein